MAYHSPRKFGHGHAVYALKHARDVADPKAVSQNLMHSHLKAPDGDYGILPGIDVRKRIGRSGSGEPKGPHEAALLSQSRELLKRLEEEG